MVVLRVQDDIMSLEEERQTLYLSVYREVYVRLVEVLLQKAHYAPEEEYASWSADDKEQFRTYRSDTRRSLWRDGLLEFCQVFSRSADTVSGVLPIYVTYQIGLPSGSGRADSIDPWCSGVKYTI